MSEIKVGDIVRWYDYYADGNIVRNGGKGFVTEIRGKSIYSGNCYSIYRIKEQDEQVFSESCIELISKKGEKNGSF